MIKNYKIPYLYDIRVKYINGVPVELLHMPAPVFNPDEVHTLDDLVDLHSDLYNFNDVPKKVQKRNTDSVSAVCARRAKRRLSDYIRCNPDMDYFVTLTLSPEMIDRYDYSAIIKKLNNWLGNRVRRQGLKYILVPEHHKDGAVHFHGVMNDALSLSFSGRYLRNGKAVTTVTEKPIYNIANFDLGYTTAIKITGPNGTEAVANYVKKYITKDFKKVGGRYYLHGGSMQKPDYEYLRLSDYDFDLAALPCTIDYEIYSGAHARLCYGEDILTFLGLLKKEELPKFGS